jgi:hypothetical protein
MNRSAESKNEQTREFFRSLFSRATTEALDNKGFSPCQSLHVPFADCRPMPYAGAKAHRAFLALVRPPSAGFEVVTLLQSA